MLTYAQEQLRKPTNEKTENKQIPPFPAHTPPPPPPANPPGLSVDLVQVQNFLLSAIQAARGFCSHQADRKQAAALGSSLSLNKFL